MRQEEMSKWNKLRQPVIERDQGRCVFCGTECLGKDQHVHHISQDREKLYDIDNLVTLCADCHSNGSIKGIHKTRCDPQSEDIKMLFRFMVMLNRKGAIL